MFTHQEDKNTKKAVDDAKDSKIGVEGSLEVAKEAGKTVGEVAGVMTGNGLKLDEAVKIADAPEGELVLHKSLLDSPQVAPGSAPTDSQKGNDKRPEYEMTGGGTTTELVLIAPRRDTEDNTLDDFTSDEDIHLVLNAVNRQLKVDSTQEDEMDKSTKETSQKRSDQKAKDLKVNKIRDIVKIDNVEVELISDNVLMCIDEKKVNPADMRQYYKKKTNEFFKTHAGLEVVDSATPDNIIAELAELKAKEARRLRNGRFDIWFDDKNHLEVEAAIANQLFEEEVIKELEKLMAEIQDKTK